MVIKLYQYLKPTDFNQFREHADGQKEKVCRNAVFVWRAETPKWIIRARQLVYEYRKAWKKFNADMTEHGFGNMLGFGDEEVIYFQFLIYA